MKIETYEYLERVLSNRSVDNIKITFSNGEYLIIRKTDNEVIVYLDKGYIDVYNGGDNKYYSIDQIVSIETYVPKTP